MNESCPISVSKFTYCLLPEIGHSICLNPCMVSNMNEYCPICMSHVPYEWVMSHISEWIHILIADWKRSRYCLLPMGHDSYGTWLIWDTTHMGHDFWIPHTRRELDPHSRPCPTSICPVYTWVMSHMWMRHSHITSTYSSNAHDVAWHDSTLCDIWQVMFANVNVHDISFAKEPCKRDDILQKRPITLNVNVYHISDNKVVWHALSRNKYVWHDSSMHSHPSYSLSRLMGGGHG